MEPTKPNTFQHSAECWNVVNVFAMVKTSKINEKKYN